MVTWLLTKLSRIPYITCLFNIGYNITNNQLLSSLSPSAPGVPSRVSFPLVTLTTAEVVWAAPSQPNGNILGYRVTYGVTASGGQARPTVKNDITSDQLVTTTITWLLVLLLLLLLPDYYYHLTTTTTTTNSHTLISPRHSMKVRDLTPHTRYTFTVTARTSLGWGDQATADVITVTNRSKYNPPPLYSWGVTTGSGTTD